MEKNKPDMNELLTREHQWQEYADRALRGKWAASKRGDMAAVASWSAWYKRCMQELEYVQTSIAMY